MSDPMTPEQKAWIDEASYSALLHKWRFGPVGDPMFTGETGNYYERVLAEKKEIIGHEGAVEVSKMLGWGPDNRR